MSLLCVGMAVAEETKPVTPVQETAVHAQMSVETELADPRRDVRTVQ